MHDLCPASHTAPMSPQQSGCCSIVTLTICHADSMSVKSHTRAGVNV
jgi:hypothetical protein